jgi:hypothetical protein
MVTRPLISPRTAVSLGVLARRGFKTALALVEPKYPDLPIFRQEPDTGWMVEVGRGEFLVQMDNRVAGRGVEDESVRGNVLSGQISNLLEENPFRFVEGDRFTIHLGPCTIVAILADQFGIARASWQVEGGAA